jgi:hypothetical protein
MNYMEQVQCFSVSQPLCANSVGIGLSFQRVTIETLSDDTLLNVFRRCMDTAPQFWPTLAWVCHRWRQIIFTSPLGLNLRLHCTYGTPVLKTLDCWPTLPIIVQYGGFPNLKPPAPKDEDNIIVALKQSGRVSSIDLTVTSSLLEKLSAISEPFLGLEKLALFSRDTMPLALPNTFRWGPHLRTLHSTKIAFASFPQLLLPSQNLVDIQLHEIPISGYFAPDAFADSLSEMAQLETLSLHFLSLPPRRTYLNLPPQPGERVVLPSLTCFKYRGTSKYLDNLVARIDTPRLGDIDITLFSQPTMDTSQLGRFIERIEMQTSLTQAEVQTSPYAISISFTNSSTSGTPLRLQISCRQLDWQLSSMAQVCGQLSPFLFRVKELNIDTTQSPNGQDDLGGEQSLDLFRAFGAATDLRVAGVLVSDILCALRPADRGRTNETSALPALRNLHADKPIEMHGLSWDAIQSFIISRSLSGRPVKVHVPSYQCHICHANFEQQQALKCHLGGKHVYQFLCSYCGDFECTPSRGLAHLLREHLEDKHPDVARNDKVISNPFLTSLSPLQHESLVYRHGSVRAPELAVPFTTVTPPQSL